MSKPDDIPQDIWEAADATILELDELVDFSNDGRITASNIDKQYTQVQEIIARAIMAAKAEEREACAKAAGDSGFHPFNGPVHDVVSTRIVAAIRKRGEG